MTDYLSFNIIIDDIVFPDGRTFMGVLGGGGPQATFGMRLWSDSVGLIASVGPDLPPSILEWFQETEIDLSFLSHADQPTPRAWQVMETDGRRTQVWRVSSDAVEMHLKYGEEHVQRATRNFRGIHHPFHPLEPTPVYLDKLSSGPGLVSLETYKPAERPSTMAEINQLASKGEIFSLNLMEAQSLLGKMDSPALLARFLELGMRVVVIRLGSEGSLTAQQGRPQAVHIPVIPTQVVDPVGAGNAFCGGFMVAWDKTHDIVHAAACGSTAASFLVEQVGLPVWSGHIRPEAERRLRFALNQVHYISLPQGGMLS